jgi:preprotein translocase subunit SecG
VKTLRTILIIVDALVAVGLVVSVLLQSGRSAGLGSISGGGEALFGKKKGLDDFLSKVTAYLAAFFMCLALIISLI